MDNTLPKVLIVGHSFNSNGIGITIKNLFSQFPKEKLGCIAFQYTANDNGFSSFYLLGKSEIKYLFPFNLFERVNAAKVIDEIDKISLKEQKTSNVNRSKLKHNIYKKIIQSFLKLTKLYVYRTQLQVTNELIIWGERYQPDVIYTALGSLNMMKFVLNIKKEFPDAKLVIHIMDDWISTQSEQALFSRHYKKQLDCLFQEILNKSSIRLVISEKMAEDYQARFGRSFLPFHNPVDISEYTNDIKKQNQKQKKIITYIGKINDDNFDVMNDMIKVVDKLNSLQNHCLFFIYSPTDPIYIKQHLKDSPNVRKSKAIPHQKVATILKNSDILFLPLSFEEKSKKYTRLSISTKITEYMASRVPMIVYAPKDIAITKYADNNRIAYIVKEKSIDKLMQGVKYLFNNPVESKKIANKAFLLVKEKHSLEKVSADFKRVLSEI